MQPKFHIDCIYKCLLPSQSQDRKIVPYVPREYSQMPGPCRTPRPSVLLARWTSVMGLSTNAHACTCEPLSHLSGRSNPRFSTAKMPPPPSVNWAPFHFPWALSEAKVLTLMAGLSTRGDYLTSSSLGMLISHLRLVLDPRARWRSLVVNNFVYTYLTLSTQSPWSHLYISEVPQIAHHEQFCTHTHTQMQMCVSFFKIELSCRKLL